MAGSFFFSTGSPDGNIATLSRIASTGKLETETADDFITPVGITTINSATFTGLLTAGTPLSAITQVEIELYHVFPIDSNPPDGRVLTRVNSPSDNNFDARDSNVAGQMSLHCHCAKLLLHRPQFGGQRHQPVPQPVHRW
jgi:hypothetical protein